MNPRSNAFSLIELLVVISVIVALAALTFPVIGAVKRAQAIHRGRAELAQIEGAIEIYKEKLGYYPPDNPGNWFYHQLYYELMGTTVTNSPPIYQTLDGSARLAAADFNTAFPGNKVTGFLNTTKAGGGDEVAGAVQFLKNLKPAQFLKVSSGAVTYPILGVSMSGSPVVTTPAGGEIVPYGYVSSSPQHNTKSFDLWVDIVASGKTNRICNWSERPFIVYYTTLPAAYP